MDSYKILGLDKSTRPSFKVIHDTYHALAREHHPDKNLLDLEAATAKFQELQSAYSKFGFT